MQSLILSWALFLGTSFEGEIVYVNTYIVHDQSLSIDSLRGIVGDTIVLVMKEGNYKLVSTGWKRVTATYEGERNIWNVYNNRRDTIVAVTGLAHTMESPIFEVPQNSNETVLGFNCKSVVMTWKTGRNVYYYNEGLRIDPDLYKGHNIDGWNGYCEVSKSVPLMIKYEKKGYTVVQKAVQIREREVEWKEVQVPLGRPILRLK